MNGATRTTIRLPKEILQRAKYKALRENKSLNELLCEALEKEMGAKKEHKKIPSLEELKGKYSLGGRYRFNRKKLYDEILKRRVSYRH